MREISIRSLYRNLSKEVEDLPFAVTKNGKVIGYMVKCLDAMPKGLDNPDKCLDNKPKCLDTGFRPYGKLAQLSEGRKKYG